MQFKTATVVAFKIGKVRVVSGSSSHRRQSSKLDDGYLVVEKVWDEF